MAIPAMIASGGGSIVNLSSVSGLIGGHNLAPLWEVLHTIVRKEPKPASVPTIWRYDEIRPDIPVEAFFDDVTDEFTLIRFRPRAS